MGGIPREPETLRDRLYRSLAKGSGFKIDGGGGGNGRW